MQLAVEMWPSLDVGHRLAARGDRRQKILHVIADRRGDVLLQVLLRLVLRDTAPIRTSRRGEWLVPPPNGVKS